MKCDEIAQAGSLKTCRCKIHCILLLLIYTNCNLVMFSQVGLG